LSIWIKCWYGSDGGLLIGKKKVEQQYPKTFPEAGILAIVSKKEQSPFFNTISRLFITIEYDGNENIEKMRNI